MKSLVINVFYVDEDELPSGEAFCQTLASAKSYLSCTDDEDTLAIIMREDDRRVAESFSRTMKQLRNEIKASEERCKSRPKTG